MSDYQSEVLEQMKRQVNLLAAAVELLTKIEQASQPTAPNYRRKLGEFARFDWASIGAVPVATDRQGVSEVEWNLHRFTRRAGAGKFGQAIWFSRPTGKDGDETLYARLITFKDGDSEPIPAEVVSAANGKARK